jgi:hypothetical protein
VVTIVIIVIPSIHSINAIGPAPLINAIGRRLGPAATSGDHERDYLAATMSMCSLTPWSIVVLMLLCGILCFLQQLQNACQHVGEVTAR